jgi:hypothetical protein
MKHRIASSIVVAAAVLAVSASTAAAASTVYAQCGTVTARGTTWMVGAAGITCAKARALVRELGAKPTPTLPNLYYHGTYLGMRCLGGKGSVHGIECVGGGHTVVAVAKR